MTEDEGNAKVEREEMGSDGKHIATSANLLLGTIIIGRFVSHFTFGELEGFRNRTART